MGTWDIDLAPASSGSASPAAAAPATLLHCPIRGPLNVQSLAKDGLTPTEEAQRIDFLQFLLDREYPQSHIAVETILLKLGESGRNSLRCDVIVYSVPEKTLTNLDMKKRLAKAILVAEIKRDNNKKESAWEHQLEPAMRLLPGMKVQGVYWDSVDRLLFSKKLVKDDLHIYQDTLSSLPLWGVPFKRKLLVASDLRLNKNLVGLLFSVANVMRSHGVNDEQVRYKETVKLILAKYCDEREGEVSPTKSLSLQVYPDHDPTFLTRIKACYTVAAKRYSNAKQLFSSGGAVTELEERTLKGIIRKIQGTSFGLASNETMQQIFMSFVPAVFKKSLDQYFTPIELVKTMVHMAAIGPNDKIADPGMGTADFLTAACEDRLSKGDTDIMQRIYGSDIDQRAYELAVVNMILNRDGQSHLKCEDSIKNHASMVGEIGVALCNPPFGEKSVENRPLVLGQYDLGHEWDCDEDTGRWTQSSRVRASQNLGIMFIEKCYKMLDEGGRLAIILPEGYLCTPIHGYVREWLVTHMRIISLIELPRRIFVKANADLRSNILLLQKVSVDKLQKLVEKNYPIHANMVRKVGFKMGKGYSPLYVRDRSTGIELRDTTNARTVDTDFRRVAETYDAFTIDSRWKEPAAKQRTPANWSGATINDILNHTNLDLKPRRLMAPALQNVRTIRAGSYQALSDIADVLTTKFDIMGTDEPDKLWRVVAGLDIRAVEGFVTPSAPVRAWQIAEQKNRNIFIMKDGDIVIGLVRPERRNIGLLLAPHEDIAGMTDGIAVIRVKPSMKKSYPQEWLFSALRSEACRLQFWTESGGTSYGKLSDDHIENILIPIPEAKDRVEIAKKVTAWATAVKVENSKWEDIWSESDRRPIVNSSGFGLIEVGDEDEEEDGDA